MVVWILEIVDAVAQVVRVRGSVGEFTGFWMDDEMPSIGEHLDVEVSFG